MYYLLCLFIGYVLGVVTMCLFSISRCSECEEQTLEKSFLGIDYGKPITKGEQDESNTDRVHEFDSV
jgi:hypothetical protein